MAEQLYEYIIIPDYIYHPGGGMRIFDFKSELNQEEFNKNLGEHIKKLTETHLNDGWQIISHNITLIGDVLFLSILLQRRCT